MRVIALSLGISLMLIPGYSQNISGSIRGIVIDPGSAAVPNADITLVSSTTGAVLRTKSSATGAFVYPSVLAGNYNLSVELAGFQKYERKRIELTASEIRDLGQITLTLGQVKEIVSVVDTATPLQTASGEKSGLVSGTQLNELALKGRDFFSLTTLMPGVVDNGSQSRDAASYSSISGISINGARSEMKNFTVDGVTALDTGNNNGVHYEPNMDSIAEVKVLTSNFQAEYGRSAGGLISVITKGGGQEFHGTGWWTHRHEEFNANNYFRNRVGLEKTPYRYNIAGFSIGGPVYFPKHFNRDKSKLFFFASQEYTRQKVDNGNQFRNMPTAFEREGNFSRSYDVNGKLIPVIDPSTASPFPGNMIPATRINKIGRSILNFFPLPNYVDPDPALVYRQNYKAAASGAHPRRNDMIRLDAYPTQKLHAYFRWINDNDDSENPFQGFNYAYTSLRHPLPGHGYAGHVTYTISPALLNELIVGKSWNSWQWQPADPAALDRSLVGNVPQWFPNNPTSNVTSEAIDARMLPNLQFGGTPVNSPSVTVNNIQHVNHNDTWDINDNVSWIKGSHNFKTGIYVNLTDKVQIQGDAWNGILNFGVNKNNPFDSGNGYANALLGNFNTYTESTRDINFHAKYWTLEFFVQDNWRVNKKLTLDYGVRFYHLTPQIDLNHTFVAFDPQAYDPAKAPRLYRPGFDANKKRVAVDPLTGAIVIPEMIGKYVPGSGDYANGMRVGGLNGYPGGLYTVSALSATPRFGFAYDVTGRGKTVIRGGMGIFLDRSRQLVNVNTVNNPPVAYRPTAYYGNLDTFAQSAGAVGPSASPFVLPEKNAKQPSVTSFSFGIQRQLPFSTMIDISYVGNVSAHMLQARQLNQIAMYARFDPVNADPTLARTPLPADFYRPYPGLADLTAYEFAASSNYHSLQTSLQRRFTRRLGFGVSYTFSKGLGVSNSYTDTVSSYFAPRHWDYGPLNFDRSQVFTLNYMYQLPDPALALKNKAVSAVTANWAISGVTSFYSGAPFTPGMSTTYTSDITGSGEGARITVIGDPKLAKSEKSFYRNFRQEVFALTPVGGFGNAGNGILRGPGTNNWDISATKKIPVGLGESRTLQFRTEFYNAFNHTQFSSVDSGARFDQTGKQVNLNFGAFTAARAPRIISFALRFRW